MCIGYGCICVLNLYLIVYFLMEMWYNYVIHKIQATYLPVALVNNLKHTGEYMTKRYHTFQHFLLLKQTNPSAYYTAKTMREMLLSCQQLGDSFFDEVRRAA